MKYGCVPHHKRTYEYCRMNSFSFALKMTNMATMRNYEVLEICDTEDYVH